MDTLTKADDLFVPSRDGTPIHCRCSGHGPGVVLVHGAMQTAGSLGALAGHLSSDFTVFAVDRRGRRPSGPAGEAYSLQKEVEDLLAVLKETGATRVFGLSSGALIAMRTALAGASLTRLALYEPPLAITGARRTPLRFVPKVEKALNQGNLAKVLTALFKGTDDPSWISLPGFIMEILFRRMAKAPPAIADEAPSFAELVPTARQDMKSVREMAGTLDDYRRLDVPVLLMGGTKSQPYLSVALKALKTVLPDASRVVLKGQGHLAPADGAPDQVARVLRDFFLA